MSLDPTGVGPERKTGETVSSVKVRAPVKPSLPATSVAVADTVTSPLPRVTRSAEARTTGTTVPPLPLTVLVSDPAVPAKVTSTEEADSAVRVMTPLDWRASEAVAPPETPVPRESSGALGAVLSTTREMVLVLAEFPAASLTTTRN